jgi:hypothetical protein
MALNQMTRSLRNAWDDGLKHLNLVEKYARTETSENFNSAAGTGSRFSRYSRFFLP